jgi:DNA uptake protein ComE-like DNA-binding protein
MRKGYGFMIATLLALGIACVQILAQAQSSQSTDTAKGRASRTAQQLDINTASKAQLDALPGIGPTYAQKIISNRPYRTTLELVKKNVIPQPTYNRIRHLIVVHPGAVRHG